MMLKHRATFLVILFFSIVSPTTPAGALDWNDPEWAGLGCPSKLSGTWVPSTQSPYAGIKIEFKSNSAILIAEKNSRVFFTFSSNSTKEPYLSLKRTSKKDETFPEYLKIRPHVAVQSLSESKKYTLCKIKVFLFESEQKASQMAYLSWDIYSTIDSTEVPHGN